MTDYSPARPELASAILRRDGHRVTVTDLDTAAYVFFRHVQIVDAVQLDKTIYHTVFYDPDKRVEQLVVEFANSPAALYADAMKRLKRVLRRMNGGSR